MNQQQIKYLISQMRKVYTTDDKTIGEVKRIYL